MTTINGPRSFSSTLLSELVDIFENHFNKVLTCGMIWLAFALAETFKTTYFSYNKWFYLQYFTHSFYIFLPWIYFSVVIGLVVKRTHSLRWTQPTFIFLHSGVCLLIAALHVSVLASSYWLFTPSAFVDQDFFQLYQRLAVTWFNYETLAYFALAIMWTNTFNVHQANEQGPSSKAEASRKVSTFTLNTSEGLVPVNLNEIEWLVADNNYTIAQISGQQLRVRSPLKDLLNTLNELSDSVQFIQTHRSAAVNLQQVTLIDKIRVVTRSGSRLPISRRRYKQLSRQHPLLKA